MVGYPSSSEFQIPKIPFCLKISECSVFALCIIQYAIYSSLTTKVPLLQAGLAKLIGLAGETNVQVRSYLLQ